MTPHLCHVFPSFGTGGPEVRTAQLINAFGYAYRHTIVALDGDLSGRARLQRNELVPCLAGPPRRGRLRHPLDLAVLLRALAPDLVLTYGWGGTDGILGALLAGLARVLHAEDGFLPEEAHGQKWARRLARRVLLNRARGVIVPSRVLVRSAEQLWKLPRARIHYVPNGIDLGCFAPAAAEEKRNARASFGLPPDELVVGTVGRLGVEKNQGRLLRCFARAAHGRKAHLMIVGDGPTRGALFRQAGEAGLNGRAHFTGMVVDPSACYRALDVFALTSDTEQMPLAVLEAMATGLPVVSTDVGDVRAMVAADNQPFVVPRDHEPAFTDKLSELLDQEETRSQLGEANRQECLRRFDVRTMVATYRGLYDDVLARS